MNVAALNDIGITLCMAFGLAVFYFVGRKNARKKAGRETKENVTENVTENVKTDGQPSSRIDAEPPRH